MARYHFTKGGRFWAVSDAAAQLTITFGAIGSAGRTVTKKFADPTAAQREQGRLIRTKEREGYARTDDAPSARKAPKRAEPLVPHGEAAAPTGDAAALDAVLVALADFRSSIAALGPKGPLFIRQKAPIERCSASAIAQFEKAWKRPLPADLRAFWTAGFTNFTIEGADGTLFVDTRFRAPDRLHRSVRKIFADEADVHAQALASGEYSPTTRAGDYERGRLYATGVPLVDDENYLVWDSERGGVWQTSGEPSPVPTRAIAPTFALFLRHYVAAGCFQCGTSDRKQFESFWKVAHAHTSITIPWRENLWLQHLSRFYPGKNALFPSRPT